MPHNSAPSRDYAADWLRSPRQGWVGLIAAVAAILLLAASASPAAAKPDKGATDGIVTDPVVTELACAEFLRTTESTTLDDVQLALGVGGADLGLDGRGIGIAIIDTGINPIEGLQGRNKLVDGADLSFDALNDSLRHRDLHGHGTNMASIIANEHTGIAPAANLVNVKVGAANGAVDVSQVIAAIDWIVQNQDIDGSNIRVINLAYGTDGEQDYRSDPLAMAVENAWHAGIVVVVAGGNDGRGVHRLGNPAMNPYVLSVGASQPENSGTWKVPAWSSTGDGIRNPDVVAPGSAIVAMGEYGSYLVNSFPEATCFDGENLLQRGSGTSQAAAVVSGSVALLLEQRPELSPDQVKHLLTSTAVDLQAHPTQQGHGMVDLASALAAPTPGNEAVQVHERSTGLGSLDGARGSSFVGNSSDRLSGELTAFGGDWTPESWASGSASSTAWTDQQYSSRGKVWAGGTWSGATWSSGSWSSGSWSSGSWSSGSWSGAAWSSGSWSSGSWSSGSWSSGSWSSGSWSGVSWR